ncbi:MAG: KH domain-containing protein [Clostridia bacterium]|nr:KH domain-containing protein [Clostridia bacterium]
MKDFLEIVVRQLVDHPEQVVVEEEETERGITYKVNVAEEDKGQVIGKEGKIAKALRTVTKAASRNMPKMVFVDIV